jgi:hypothetical protein
MGLVDILNTRQCLYRLRKINVAELGQASLIQASQKSSIIGRDPAPGHETFQMLVTPGFRLYLFALTSTSTECLTSSST